jgi:AraC-like DNA-binding protein
MLEFLDTILRYGAIALFIWAGGMLLYYSCGRIQARIGAYTSFSTAAYLLCSDQVFWNTFGDNARLLVPFCVMNIGFIWLFCISLFHDDLKLKPIYYLIPLAFFFSGVPYVLDLSIHPILGGGIVDHIITAGRVALIIHVIYVAWRGRDIDLIEKRREFRLLFVGIVVITSLVILVVETLLPTRDVGPELKLLQSSTFLLIAAGVLSRISKIEADAFFMPVPHEAISNLDVASDLCRPEDEYNLAALSDLMAQEIYKEPGLTTAVLAEKAKMPEHRMRHLINKHMGYRNFADYLNYHRVEAAKRRLSDVNERHIPVLTIAMELGYQSLGPFNRAFKERTSLTPTAYRKANLAATPNDLQFS